MKIETHTTGTGSITEVVSPDILITDAQTALDLLMDLAYHHSSSIIFYERNFTPSFFDLRSGLAGEVLQKCSNYQLRLAIVGEFEKYTSKSLADFIFESNKHRQVNFVGSVEDAVRRLSGQ